MDCFIFFVPGPLPGMNEIVAAAKKGGRGMAYSAMKKQWTQNVAAAVLKDRNRPRLLDMVRVEARWFEPSGRKRDPDNVHAGIKFVLDGLVTAGVLKGDGPGVIKSIEHRRIEYSDQDSPPGVEIALILL